MEKHTAVLPVALYSRFTDYNQHERRKKSEADNGICFCVRGRQKPQGIHNQKTKEKTDTEDKQKRAYFKKKRFVTGKHLMKTIFHVLDLFIE